MALWTHMRDSMHSALRTTAALRRWMLHFLWFSWFLDLGTWCSRFTKSSRFTRMAFSRLPPSRSSPETHQVASYLRVPEYSPCRPPAFVQCLCFSFKT